MKMDGWKFKLEISVVFKQFCFSFSILRVNVFHSYVVDGTEHMEKNWEYLKIIVYLLHTNITQRK